MSFGDFIWLFFIFTSLQPMITQKLLEASRFRSLRRLEERRRSRVIALGISQGIGENQPALRVGILDFDRFP